MILCFTPFCFIKFHRNCSTFEPTEGNFTLPQKPLPNWSNKAVAHDIIIIVIDFENWSIDLYTTA